MMNKILGFIGLLSVGMLASVSHGENIGVKPNFSQVEILTAKKNISADGVDEVILKECKKWTLNKKQISRIFQLAEPVSDNVWHYRFSYLPCSYSGEFRYQGKNHYYDLNAGGTFRTDLDELVIDDIEMTAFGCLDKKCFRYFLDEPFSDE